MTDDDLPDFVQENLYLQTHKFMLTRLEALQNEVRTYKLWEYVVSHQRLVIAIDFMKGHVRPSGHSGYFEYYFGCFGLDYLKLPTVWTGTGLRLATRAECEKMAVDLGIYKALDEVSERCLLFYQEQENIHLICHRAAILNRMPPP